MILRKGFYVVLKWFYVKEKLILGQLYFPQRRKEHKGRDQFTLNSISEKQNLVLLAALWEK
jgi:hypothetical protein